MVNRVLSMTTTGRSQVNRRLMAFMLASRGQPNLHAACHRPRSHVFRRVAEGQIRLCMMAALSQSVL